MFPFRFVSVTPKLPEQICRLKELAYNFWFTWKPGGVEFFRTIKPELWREAGHNPVRFLMQIREEDLVAASRDEDYLALYNRVFEQYDRYLTEEKWFEQHYPEHKDHVIAYFSAEFGLHESHPIYSGGLGLLAGDHCKSASDLGLPFVGVGLLYKHGYFTQKINGEGRQEAEYPFLNFFELPITPVNDSAGNRLLVPVELPGRTIYIQVWKARVGRVCIYLLDADIPRNTPEDRGLTGSLYGGDRECRISQEIILGIGGVKALRAMGINPRAWHINEGHPAFLVIQRIRELVRKGVSLETAREVIRSSTIFTTHTPVPAGHDLFSGKMIELFFTKIASELGLDLSGFLELAWDAGRDSFNMTLLALNHSYLTNGVSWLHGKVARDMFRARYNRLHPEEIPITSITNGVHTGSWLAGELRDLFARYLGKGFMDHVNQRQAWEKIDNIPDEELWRVHRCLKEKMIGFVRNSIKKQRRRNYELTSRILEVDEYLNPEVLTIGFARRFATYKRATLLFRDRERLSRLVNDPYRPVRFIFAGKAHPADQAGQEFIKQIYDFSNESDLRGKVLLLENYDIHMARHLIQGVDVWLNTPRRLMEASGTSGQKAALNGVVNVSTLDGWWPEAYDGKNGFAVGTEREYRDEEIQDLDDCYSLYEILEEKLIPMFYRKQSGLPLEWIRMMKNSIKTIAPVFNTGRMVAEYTERFYVPAINRGLHFVHNNYEVAGRVSAFKRFIRERWDGVAFVSVDSNARPKMAVGEKLMVSAVVRLGEIAPEHVAVEVLYGEAGDSGLSNITVVGISCEGETEPGTYRFAGNLSLPQGALGYTLRVRPENRDFPYTELPLITWAPGL